jgi:hypothetical protein
MSILVHEIDKARTGRDSPGKPENAGGFLPIYSYTHILIYSYGRR